MRALGLAVILLLAASAGSACAAPDLTLRGVMTGADHETYREVPFRVPPGVTAVTVEFAYEGGEQKSVIDLGLRDPQRLRGWSGGAKSRFTVSETWATPSYLAGPLPSGRWKLILGVPNIRKGVQAPWTARITFERGRFEGFAPAPLKTGPGWFRGDLHLHTAHSDGSCPAQDGRRVPCPLDKTLEAASARGLDFAAVTEHNTTSHHQALAEQQPFFSELLLIPGREITTFQGHANVFGVTAPLDFQLGSARAPKLDAILDEVDAAGGLVAVNHPALPSGEACMGCGWTAETDWRRIPLIEVANGAIPADSPLGGLRTWEARLDAGLRVIAIGGSDNHDAMKPLGQPGAVGSPTTGVYAADLSQAAILQGLRAGRVFVDTQGSRDGRLDVIARSGSAEAAMGGVLRTGGAGVSLSVHVAGADGGRVVLSGPAAAGAEDAGPPLKAADIRTIALPAGARGWVRADVRGPDGKLWLIGNPVWIAP